MIVSRTLRILAWLLLLLALPVQADTVLRVFIGGAAQRPDLFRTLADRYEASHPGIRIEIGSGAATSELQRKYLSVLLNAHDPSFDALMLDIVHPYQFATAGWIAPLDPYFGKEKDTLLADGLPIYRQTNLIKGKLYTLPAVTDAMFLYYRKDLLEQYGIAPPQTWQQLELAAKTILQHKQKPALQGLSMQGAPIEGTVCSFLLPYWSQGKDILDANGKLTLDKPAALSSLKLWKDLISKNVIRRHVAEVKTGDTVNTFKAGHAIFAINWGFAWGVFQNDADSLVKGKVGIIRMPAMTGGTHATCLGGWQWALSNYSRHKAQTADFLRFLASPESVRFITLQGALLPPYLSLYDDADIQAAIPWLNNAKPALLGAKSRPLTARYAQVSDVLRISTSAVLAGSLTAEEGVEDISRRLERILR
ncbi:ABC transporter substrate-binding protein [Methylobacillus gramineus]|uniref:ABC transporter substrate-binding protein n=1 Tax=Methylobacillus gramineus TaxID=755169 RepID=UPI001CFF673A|nr:ABC transporter substrate-binding protein [Methylobacillus gramineus]MCB5186100.1 ABC transporter substrate-binding protein [Methylobacillus gramineus]